MTPCPTCLGPYLGPSLRWRHAQTCATGQAEDKTQAADYDRRAAPGSGGRVVRATTEAERTLLTAIAPTRTVSAESVTVVTAYRRVVVPGPNQRPIDADDPASLL